MASKTICNCDRCGKEIKTNHENKQAKRYIDGYRIVRFDLCSNCNSELSEIIYKFINRKG